MTTRLQPSTSVMMRLWRSLGLVLLVTAVTTSWRSSSRRSTPMFADAFAVLVLPKTKSALPCTMTSKTTTTTFHRQQQQPSYRRRVVAMPLLHSQNNDNDNNNNKLKLGPKQGVYARPSAAIERGSGFFIPGLEGPKIRLAVGTVLLLATAVNHVLSRSGTSTTMSGNALAESLAIGASVVVWVQAGVQAWQELAPANTMQTGKRRQSQQQQQAATTLPRVYETWSATAAASSNVAWRQRVEWTARTYLALTAARQILYLGGDGVYYRLTRDNDNDTTTNDPLSFHDDDRARAALQETLQASPSGRLALPTTHPAAQYYCPDQACVVVQRIGANNNGNSNSDACSCWMISSNTTLAATLTQRDLTWLGPLAQYVVPPSTKK